MIASIESFFGNLWACGLCFVLGAVGWALFGAVVKKFVSSKTGG